MTKKYEITGELRMSFTGYFEAETFEEAKELAKQNMTARAEGAGFSFPEIDDIDGGEC